MKRVTLITGASSGVGAATARRIAAPGHCLLLHARGGLDGAKIPLLDSLCNEVQDAGAEAVTAIGDLADAGVAAGLVEKAVSRFGRLDGIVSNAGYALGKPIGELTADELDHSLNVITRAFFELITAALPHLTASECGRVVAVTSFVVDQTPGERLFPASAAAKGALQSLARTFAIQTANAGVTVNCVSPGFTEKETAGHSAMSNDAWRIAAEMTPNRRLAKPADVAAAIAFFLSEEAAHITGQTLRVDGGLSMI